MLNEKTTRKRILEFVDMQHRAIDEARFRPKELRAIDAFLSGKPIDGAVYDLPMDYPQLPKIMRSIADKAGFRYESSHLRNYEAARPFDREELLKILRSMESQE